jgi:hypothetical protein
LPFTPPPGDNQLVSFHWAAERDNPVSMKEPVMLPAQVHDPGGFIHLFELKDLAIELDNQTSFTFGVAFGF